MMNHANSMNKGKYKYKLAKWTITTNLFLIFVKCLIMVIFHFATFFLVHISECLENQKHKWKIIAAF